MIIKIISFFLLILILNVNDVECGYLRKRKLWLLGSIYYKGKPASNATLTVYERYMPGVHRNLLKSKCNEYGQFCLQTKRYLFSYKDLIIKVQYYYQKGNWLSCISGSFKFPIDIVFTCINRDIAPNLGTLELTEIPGFKKTRIVRHCSTRRSRRCRISLMRCCGSIH